METTMTVIANAVKTIKSAILRSQSQVALDGNRIQLSLYFGIGKYISENTRNHFWGTGAIDRISSQLQKEMPGLRGFSATNLKNMRLFFEEWNPALNRQSATDDLQKSNQLAEISTEILIKKYSVDMYEFLSLSFTHHIDIISKVKNFEERKFYIHQAFVQHWDSRTLKIKIKNNVFSNRHTMPNNFDNTIADDVQSIKAIRMFKDEYLLDFMNTEDLTARFSDVNERVVENEIVANIRKFFLTFGKDFSFISNQYRIEVCGEEEFIDLLFFNRELNCLVAVELKMGKFKTAYLGQLNGYLQVLDDTVKKPHENQSIGIILCQDAKKDFVEYAVRDYTKPIGVATYKTLDEMPEKYRKVLPDLSEMRKMLSKSEEN